MSTDIRVLTALLLAIPAGMLVGLLAGMRVLIVPLAFVVVIFAWVWLRFRPTTFLVHPDSVEVIWPLKRRTVSRSTIESCRILDGAELKREVGFAARVGAGGLWGGFGWLWTQRRGVVQMYVSRTDSLVWIERGGERPWLVTPERPEEFLRALGFGASATSTIGRAASAV
jgi:hypothetical protein